MSQVKADFMGALRDGEDRFDVMPGSAGLSVVRDQFDMGVVLVKLGFGLSCSLPPICHLYLISYIYMFE